MADKDIILEVRDLKKYFKSPTGTLHAVDGVNFSIRRGETLGLVGESGCGKSTIGRLILGLHQSTSGEILFNGQDICKMNKKQLHDLRKDLQIIFQDPFSSPVSYTHLDVYKRKFPGRYAGCPTGCSPAF